MNRRSNIFDYVIKNFWFENVKRDNHCDEEESEENRIFYYMEQFQRGNFEKKEEFVNYFLSSTEEKVFVIGMRLFMAVANHSDYRMLEEFLGQCEEWQLRVFLAYVYDGLSLHAIPYLLSLYEEWEDTGVENDIARCICGMLGQRYYEEENYNIKILGDMFLEFSQSHDLDLYYFNGEEYFAGNLTKTIIGVAMDCRMRKIPFYTDQLPAIISNGSGVACPVSHGTEVNDLKVQELFNYVQYLSTLKHEKGKKYFYNYKI